MTLVEKTKELQKILDACIEEAVKLEEKGNKTAGTRLRLNLQDLKNKCHSIRKDALVMRDKKPDAPAAPAA